nr:hypothetical protein [Tanacetum cinerariifolium]
MTNEDNLQAHAVNISKHENVIEDIPMEEASADESTTEDESVTFILIPILQTMIWYTIVTKKSVQHVMLEFFMLDKEEMYSSALGHDIRLCPAKKEKEAELAKEAESACLGTKPKETLNE